MANADNTKTVAELLTQIRNHAGAFDSDRHPDADLIGYFNLAMRFVRAAVASADGDWFSEQTAAAALPTAPPTGETFLVVDLPVGCVGVYGFDVFYSGQWWPLLPASHAQRRDFSQRGSACPSHYRVQRLAREDSANPTGPLEAGKVHIYPVSTQGLSYRMEILPVWKDITTTTHIVYGHDPTFEHVIWDCVERLAAEDDDSENTAQIAARRKAEAWAAIKRSIQLMQASEPIRPRRRGGMYR